MPKIAYTPLPYQQKFQDSSKPKVYLSTGFGGGKTYGLVMKMFKLMNQNRGMAGGILTPTLKMYRRDIVPTIKSICRRFGIKYKYHATELEWFFPSTGSIVYVYHSEDDGLSIRGPNQAWGVVNEVTLCTKGAVLALVGRIRIKKAPMLQLAVSGTPESFNWAYEYFIENPRKDTDLIFGDTRLNVHVDDSYIQTLEDSYDPLMREAYIEGRFVNLVGKRCAYAFDRRRHTSPDVEKLPYYPVLVSMDFNVSPMAATLWNRVPFGQNKYGGDSFMQEFRAFDEICIDSSNTEEMVDVLKDKLDPEDDVTLYPDPAGRARSTKSNRSDIDILRQAGFDKIKYKLRLSVRDCLNAYNAQLSKNNMIWNSIKCRQSIADNEQCVFKEGAFEINKNNLNRSHWLDGGKNMIDYECPIRKRAVFREQRIR